jgi:hypothetical protein
MSDHNVILIIYGNTHGQSWVTLPNYQYNMLYWYNKKELNTRVAKAVIFATRVARLQAMTAVFLAAGSSSRVGLNSIPPGDPWGVVGV